METSSPDKGRDWRNDFDHTDPRYASEIWEVTKDFRAHCPVVSANAHGGFKAISRAADVKAVFAAPKSFTSAQGATLPDVRPLFPMIPVEVDGKAHLAYRALLNKWLSLSKVKALIPTIKALAEQHIAAFADRGTCDFIAEFAHPFPAAVISTVMGIPQSEWRTSKGLFQDVLAGLGQPDEEVSRTAWMVFADYVTGHVEAARQGQRDGMLADLAMSQVDGRPLTRNEEIGIVFTFIAAGQDTTANSLGLLIRHLAQDQSLQARLRSDSAVIPAAVDELLRWQGPVQTVARTAAQDTEIAGCPIKAGDKLALLIGSANRDESWFPDGDRFDIDRPNSASHIAFGFGVHTCAGVHLARAELNIAVERLLSLCPPFHQSGEDEVSFAGGMLYGLSTLPIRFDPASDAGLPTVA